MAEEPKSDSWWRSLPGILTAIAGIITAIGGLIFALNQAGLIGRIKEAPPQVQSGTTKPAPAISIEPPPTPGPGRTPKPVVAPKDRAIDSLQELLEIDDDLREAILNRVDSPGLRDIASNSGMISMRGDGLGKVIDGATTIDEILRVTEDGT